MTNGKKIPFLVFINPILSDPALKNWVYSEGCLSISGVYADIERPYKITVEAQDLNGNTFKKLIKDSKHAVLCMKMTTLMEFSSWIASLAKKDRNRSSPQEDRKRNTLKLLLLS